jgi:peptidoglycan hydrolase-like protein with peptidoglycan-binding domain
VRRPFAGVLVALALLCVPAAASADGGAVAPTGAEDDVPAAAKQDERSGTVVLKRGDRGAAVRRVQAKLRVSVDGVFGAQTEAAVKRFQKRRGLSADGVVGPLTRDALGLDPFARASVRHTSSSVRLPRLLRQIAACESGGDPTAVSPGGRYRGKYQFSLTTWRNLGGAGDPADATEAQQDRIALKLFRRSGAAPWPNCP